MKNRGTKCKVSDGPREPPKNKKITGGGERGSAGGSLLQAKIV